MLVAATAFILVGVCNNNLCKCPVDVKPFIDCFEHTRTVQVLS